MSYFNSVDRALKVLSSVVALDGSTHFLLVVKSVAPVRGRAGCKVLGLGDQSMWSFVWWYCSFLSLSRQRLPSASAPSRASGPRSTAAKRITFEDSRPRAPKVSTRAEPLPQNGAGETTQSEVMFLLQIEKMWAMVACGRTQDQIDLTERARNFLKTTGLKPRSLNF